MSSCPRGATKAAQERFGADARPAAIIMTHGHFDHVGALKELAERWDAPAYARQLEFPYLNGSESYPPPDSKAGGGMMPVLSPLFPRGPIDVSAHLQTLPMMAPYSPWLDGGGFMRRGMCRCGGQRTARRDFEHVAVPEHLRGNN